MAFQLTIFTIAFLFAAACSAPPRESYHLQNSFGQRKRAAVKETNQYPYSAIGKVGSGCIGTLVSRNLGVTAGHCAVNEVTGEVQKDFQYFIPAATKSPSEKYFIDK